MFKITTVPLFTLCESGNTEESQYFLFNEKWNFLFYKSWCYNMGGSIILPESNEEFQTHLDITSKLILPELHEKCVDASGNIIMWVGYTDEDMEGKSIDSRE